MYVITVTGTSVVVHILVGQSSLNFWNPGDKKNPACIHNMQSGDTNKRIFPFLFIYIYPFSLSVYSLEEEVLSLKEQGCSNRG